MILISLLWKKLTVAETLARVESADADQLMTWSERILNATTVEKMFMCYHLAQRDRWGD